MFSLPNFCRVCLKYDKNLIDLEHIENEPSETLMSKLEHCVSEVEWTVYKPLLCHPCIKRLNIAYTFEKQCVQSAAVLKSYIALMKQSKSESQTKSDGQSTYVMLPNQKYIKIVVGPSQNSFQNVFLNVVPTQVVQQSDKKDNVVNNPQKFVPIVPLEQTAQDNITDLLIESKTEELSVEIDPTDFELEEQSPNYEQEEDEDDDITDWDDLIMSNQICSKNGDQKLESSKFVPILPKRPLEEDKNTFFNSGQHFLTSQQTFVNEVTCVLCQRNFNSVKMLKNHIKDSHMGKFPFKCNYCSAEYVLRSDCESCIKSHNLNDEDALTLNDFKLEIGDENKLDNNNDLTCEFCHGQFNSTAGLLRHKVRKHNQKNKKKYFIKGMKNAKCDICNREFSTQSYMQLHRKLHLRDDIGYKYKVFGKSKYLNNNTTKLNQNDSDTEEDDEDENCNNGKDNQHIKMEIIDDSDRN